MTITKTRNIVELRVIYEGSEANEPPSLEITFVAKWDDPDDDELPISKSRRVILRKYTAPDPTDMDADPVLTDLSGYDQDVQDIAAIIWA